jgi:hypothetical protein
LTPPYVLGVEFGDVAEGDDRAPMLTVRVLDGVWPPEAAELLMIRPLDVPST